MWQIEFTKEAANYAIDSHPYNEQVLEAIEFLAFTEDGLPTDGNLWQDEEGFIWWEVSRHLVFFRRFEAERRLRVEAIKPLA